ncbi:SpaA isopeptide-forming pilin-related protein [Clostridium hydrogeniformans]|uniref:SpaA isopeptide-forming pilin-related protein n=1 Tax=Clostridium hydrogeniformans TaxID=349933 RepID=UPI0004859A1B|nr:SpaA isopeptide-forming pilin-related protein [Clostridium hydrogeniformans]
MKKREQSIIAMLLVFIFQFSIIAPTIKVNAEGFSNTFQFITGITLTDEKGNIIDGNSKDISKKAEIIISYKFEIPKGVSVKEGDIYNIKIPKEIKIIKEMNFDITSDDGEVIGKCTIGTDGKVNIVFTDYAENHSDVSGFFYIHTQFDDKKIGGKNPVPIEFDLGQGTNPIIINVNFEKPVVPKTSIKKEGSYDSVKNEITWKVTTNPENVEVNNAQIIDSINEGQEFIAGSVELNGAKADENNYTYDPESKKLVYKFPELINKKQVLTFKTKVTDPKAFDSEGKKTYQYNKATLSHDGEDKVSNEASVEVVADYIRKNGSYDPNTKRINWVIDVNNNSRHIPNAVVIDTIPDGLTITNGSVMIDGVQTNDYEMEGQKFIYKFKEEINEPHRITFSTDVTDEEAHNSNTSKRYNNTVKITGDGVPDNAVDSKIIGVPTSIIKKQGVGYDSSTGEITWKITVNSNKITINNAVVTDNIRVGQEFVEGSASISNGASNDGFTYTKAAEVDKDKTGTLTYKFDKPISEVYTITFKTKVTDPNVYAGNRDENYYNVATLTGDNIRTSNDQGEQRVFSRVIDKRGSDYDYKTREITWRVVVNENNTKLPNAYIIDTINSGQDFIHDSLTLNGSPVSRDDYSYDEKTKTLRYNFKDTITTEQVITFKTKLTDISDFNTNGEKVYENSIKLIDDLVPGGVESTGYIKVKNTIIGKNAEYTEGNSYIDWNVNINTNEILIRDGYIEDNLQEGLQLDTTSVKLYKQILNSDGSLTKGEEVELNENSVKYDSQTRKFIFNLPSEIKEGYILTFRTDVADKSKSPFKNSASFVGTGTTESSISADVNVKFQGAGGGGGGISGSIKIIKVNADNSTEKLEGAVFELIDRYNNVIKTATTDSNNGEVVFDKIRLNMDYSIREKTPPVGYKLSNEVYKFQITKDNKDKNLVYTYKNEKIRGNIEFQKNGESGKLLQGAEFKLYKDTDTDFKNPIDVATSDENGQVHFKNVDYGDYRIKETKAPEGYNISDQVITAAIREDGATVHADPYIVNNTKIRGNIQIEKQDEEGKPLKNAEFTLFDLKENEIAKSISDGSGIAEFKNIEYGKYIIKETKAPEGYNLSEDKVTVEVTDNGKVHKAGYIENVKIRGYIQITKIDQDKNRVKGAEFTLYDLDKNVIKTVVSGEDGIALFENIDYGSYIVKETKAPEGYIGSEEEINISVVEQGVVYAYKVDNTKIKGNIQIKKTDNSGNILQGAEFTLYDSENNVVKTAISGEDGLVTFEDVDYGDYTVKETKVPEGYVASKDEIKIEVKNHGAIYSYDVENTRIKGKVQIKKTDNSGNVLSGAEFTLYDNNGNVVETAISDNNGMVTFENVDYGNYIVKETKAPEGYVASEDEIKVEVTGHEKVYSYDVENTRIKGKVQIKKTDNSGNVLSGAEFTLYDSNGDVVETAISDNNGMITFENVDYGNYTVNETKAPEGYVASKDEIKIEVTGHEAVYSYDVENTRIKGKVQIKKTDNSGNVLSGAEFTLYDSNGNVVETAISDNNGMITFENVDYGNYTVKETKAPEGYVPSKDEIKIEVKDHEKVYSYDVENTRIKGKVQIKKTDNGGNVLSGAEFTLYDSNGNVVEATISDNNGMVTFENVDYGNYTVKETKAPEGYVASKDEIKVEVKDHEAVYSYDVENTRIKGKVQIKKTDDSGSILPGAEFTLYDNSGSVVETIVSDSNGMVTFENVDYGNYTVKETKAPEGYIASSEEIKVEVKDHGAVYSYDVENTRIKGTVKIKKTDNNGNVLSGAEFTLYDNGGNVVETVVSDSSGMVIFENVDYGNYTVKETKAPEGYVASRDEIKVAVTEHEAVYSYDVENTRIKGKVQIKKTDNSGNVLSGAEFTLYDSEDKTLESNISGEDGLVTFENVDYGNYIIRETKAPEGYVASKDEIKVAVTEHEAVYSYDVENIRIKGKVQIKKIDNGGKLLEGAEFTLYDSENNEVATSLSGEDGLATFEDVDYGSYTVKETKAPEGYIKSNEEIKVEVKEHDEVYSYNVENTRIRGKIEIKKTDNKGNVLEGAEFTLYDANGEIVATSISDHNGMAIFEDVDYGNYIIKETKAPRGYILSENNIEVKVHSTETQSFTVENQEEFVPIGKTPGILGLPQTGSLINTTTLIIIGVLLILLGSTFVLKKRR